MNSLEDIFSGKTKPKEYLIYNLKKPVDSGQFLVENIKNGEMKEKKKGYFAQNIYGNHAAELLKKK